VMPELPLVGDEFAGYRMRAVLGRSGMSVVYQAENLRLNNVIALKVLAPEPPEGDPQHRSPAPHPSCRRPRPGPPGSPDTRGRPDWPA
jgi:hypothetical protein